MKIPFRQYWNLLVNYLKPQWLVVTTLALLVLSGTGLQVVNPQIMRRFIDTARAGSVPGLRLCWRCCSSATSACSW